MSKEMPEDGYLRSDLDGDPTVMERLMHLLSVLSKYRRLVIIVTVTALVGAVAFSVVSIRLPPDRSPLPDTYTASATLLVLKGMSSDLSATILSALGIESRNVESASVFDMGELVLFVCKSRTIIDKAIEDLGLSQRYRTPGQTRSRLRDMVLRKCRFEYNRTTSAITISFEDTDPVLARDVANEMVALLNGWFAQNLGTTNTKQKQLLEEKVKAVRADIDTLENRLRDLQTKYGVLTAQDLGTTQATTLAALRSQLILKEIDIKNYSATSTIEDPKLQQLREERQSILDLISQTQRGVPDAQGASTQANLPDVQMEFNNLTVELEVQRKIYDTLSHQYEVSKLTSESESSFQVLDLAEVPDRKSGPSRTRIVAIVGIAALLAGVAMALFLNSLGQYRRGQMQAMVRRRVTKGNSAVTAHDVE